MARVILGIDVGGSSVKAGLVDVAGGRLESELLSAPTPAPASPEGMMPVFAELAARLSAPPGPVGLCFPSVIKDGKARTAANIASSWLGVDGAALASRTLGRPVVFLNDADAAGIAEMRLGAGRGVLGPVLMLTLGTGIGTALFIEGRLYPNTELGHLELRGMDAEKYASAHVRAALKLDWPAWCARVNEYLERMHALLWPDLIIIGGSVTEHFDQFAPLLSCEAEIRRAHFAAQAGVVGAALAAAE
ncbi:MAG: polyphosphate--glucose phosphotransferase [Steroidobacteraceae bacterium]